MKPQVPQQTRRWVGFAMASKEPCNGHEEQQLHDGLSRKRKGKWKVQLRTADIDKEAQLTEFPSVGVFVQSNSDHGSMETLEILEWRRLWSPSHKAAFSQFLEFSVT